MPDSPAPPDQEVVYVPDDERRQLAELLRAVLRLLEEDAP
jgi:hypothetical protein